MGIKMECKNCGSAILEGDRFCSKCGTRVTEEAKPEEAKPGEAKAGEAKAGEEKAEDTKAERPIPLCIPEEKPLKPQNGWNSIWKGMGREKRILREPGKPGKWIPKALLCVLGVVAVALLANSAKLVNSYHRNFSTPEEYYRWVEQKSIRENAKTFAEYYVNYFVEYLHRYDSHVSGEIRLELGDAGREMMESAGLEPWFGEWAFRYESTSKDSIMQSILGLEVDGDKLFGLDAVMDLQDEAVYLGFPELTKTYLAVDTGERKFISGFEEIVGMEPEEYLEALELLEVFYKECPDRKQMEALANRYLELLLNNIDDVKMRTGKTARAGSVTQTCTTLEIYLDKEDIRNMLSEFLEELREDSEVETLLYQVFGLAEELDLNVGSYRDADEFYGAFQDNIDEILDDMDYYVTYHDELDMTVYVDDRGQIIGRTMEFPNSWDEISLSYLYPHHGSRFGYKASIMADGEEVSVTGSGKEFWNKMDGSFTIKYEGNGVVDVEVEDFDLKSLRKGYLNGCFTVTAASGIGRAWDMRSAYSSLREMRLIFDVSTGRSSEKVSIELKEGRSSWGSLTITSKRGDGKKISVPSTKSAVFVEDERDFEDWWDTIDWDDFIKKMDKAGLPSDIMDAVEEFSEMSAGEFLEELSDIMWLWIDMD